MTKMKQVLLALLVTQTLLGAPKKPVLSPYHDPPDQLFRMAPMPESSRSLVVKLSKDIHLAFDTYKLRTHTVWKGKGLDLYGPCYHGGKRPFICHLSGKVLWTNAPFNPWSFSGKTGGKFPNSGDDTLSIFRGFTTSEGRVTFHYQVSDKNGKQTTISEEVHAANNAIHRSYSIEPLNEKLLLCAHTEEGRPLDLGLPNAVAIQRDHDILISQLKGKGALSISQVKVDYTEEIFSEDGSSKGNSKRRVNGPRTVIECLIETRGKPVEFELISFLAKDKESATRFLKGNRPAKSNITINKPLILNANPKARRSFVNSPYYKTESLALPDELNLLVTGMDWLTEDHLAVCTYVGEVWVVENVTGSVKKMKFRRFARGMNEPMGVLVKEGKIHLGNKAEITRLSDTNKDGMADLFESVCNDWDYTGSYNSFSYGPVLDHYGNFVVANAGHAGHWGARHMGWALRNKPGSAKAEPFASGFREPNGIGTFGTDKDIFVTDNQGSWIGVCKLNHVKEGGFYGHPASKPAPKELYAGRKNFDQPAVWFPYKWVRSASGMCEITDDRFGPFKGQLLVGDFQNAVVTRVQMEKVDGEWQGTVWPFLKGFQSGVNRLLMGADGNLYVGGCKVRAWAANAPSKHGLERVSFRGKIPFEVKSVKALPNGFELKFTKPVDPITTQVIDGYDVWQYKYKYHKNYGSPEFDHDGKENSFTRIDVTKTIISKDGLKLTLILDGWKAGYVTAVRALDASSAMGEKLWHNTFYYTLNRIPK